jgi:hypothetical protein
MMPPQRMPSLVYALDVVRQAEADLQRRDGLQYGLQHGQHGLGRMAPIWNR